MSAFRRWVGGAAWLVLGCTGEADEQAGNGLHQVRAAITEAGAAVLSFENPADWTPTGGTVAATGTSLAGSAVAFSAAGTASIKSRTLASLGDVGQQLTVNLQLPPGQSNPYWYGSLQAHVDIPSLGVNSHFLGHHELTGRPLGVFQTYSFDIAGIEAQLESDYHDLRVTFTVNVPPGNGPYVFDEASFGTGAPTAAPDPSQLTADILGFEDASQWSGPFSVSSVRSQGNHSLGFPGGFQLATSQPAISVHATTPFVVMSVRLAPDQPNPDWFGQVMVHLTSAQLQLDNEFVGAAELSGLPLGEFVDVTIPIAPALFAALSANPINDLSARISMNTPSASGTRLLIDNLRIGGVSPDDIDPRLLPQLISVTAQGFFENTAVVIPPSATCDLGSIVVNMGQPRTSAGAYQKPLLNPDGSLDFTTLATRHVFPAPSDGLNGTDNQLVRLKDGSLLAERDHAFWSEVDPPTPWSNLLLFGGNGEHVAYRGGLAFYRSTDCGATWDLQSTIDAAYFQNGDYGWPRSGSTNDNGTLRGAGADRTELYSCPFTGNVYATTRFISGPFDDGTNSAPARDDLFLLVSKNNGANWEIITDQLASWSPVMMTSTPNGRLFLFQIVNGVPQVRYTDPISDPNDAITVSAAYPAYYTDEFGQQVNPGLAKDVDYIVNLSWPSVSRVSVDTTTSKIRASYPFLDATGSVNVAIIRIEAFAGDQPPFVANITTVQSRSPSEISAEYFSFVDPDYVDMPDGVSTNSAVGYWVEARRCRDDEADTCGCLDLSTNAFNCGECGNQCATTDPADPEVCNNGMCVSRNDEGCDAGETLCGANCIDLQTDPRNCGACSVECDIGQDCEAGSCVGPGEKHYAMRMMHFSGDCDASPAMPLSIETDGSLRGWNQRVDIGDYAKGGFWWDGKPNYFPQWREPSGIVGAALQSPFGLSNGEPHVLSLQSSTGAFGERAAELQGLGWQITDLLSVLQPDGSVAVDTVWQPIGLGPATTWIRGYVPADFEQAESDLRAAGWGMDDLATSLRTDGTVRVDAVWRAGMASTTAWIRGFTPAGFEAQEAQRRADGWGLHRLLTSLRSDGTVRVDAVWRANTADDTLWVRGFLPEDFQEKVDELEPQGWRIASVATSQRSDGTVRVDAIWHKNIVSTWVRGFAVDDFRRVAAERRCQGWTMEQVMSSFRPDGTPRVDAVWRKY